MRGVWRGGRATVVKLALGAIVLLAAALFVMEMTLRPALEAVIEQTVQVRAREAINRAILGRLVSGIAYEDLYTVRENSEGGVAFVQPNYAVVNRVAADVSLAVQRELKKMEDQYFGIYLSQVLGSKLLATRGPAIRVGMESVGTVNVDLESRFDQAGFNQTRHLVYFHIRADIQVVTPTFRKLVQVTERVPIAEGIIVGPVPAQGILDFRGTAVPPQR